MDFREKHVLALGRYGLVGQAIARRLVKERPRRITLLSLGQEEAQDVVATLAAEALGVELVIRPRGSCGTGSFGARRA